MEQLRTDLQHVRKEFNNLQSMTASFINSLDTQQDARTPRPTTQRETGRSNLITKNLGRSLLDAYSQFELHLKEIDQKIENALSTGTPTCDCSSSADSPDSPDSCADSPSADNTSRKDSPSTDNTSRNDSPSAEKTSRNDSPSANKTSRNDSSNNFFASAGSPAVGAVSRTPLPFSRPAPHPPHSSALLGNENSRADSPPADGLKALPGVPPSTGLGYDSARTPSFTLGLSNLGEGLIPKLKTFIGDPNFTGKLSVQGMGLAPIALMKTVQPQIPGSSAQFEVSHQLDDGTWRLYVQPVDELQLPNLSDVAKPSEEDVEQYLEGLYRNLPQEPIPYYVGPLSGPLAEKLQSNFPSGNEVRQLGDVRGVSTLYGHVGGKASGTAFHCEDANCRSYNLVLIGGKIWIMIKLHHTAKFEELVRRLTGCDTSCDQFVRHTSVVIPPSKLRAEGIEFDIIFAGPGDMVVTQPRQYHAVINRTASFAIATNFVLPDEDPIPERLPVCHLDGFYHLEHEMVRKLRPKRKALGSPSSRRQRPRLHETSPSPSEVSVVEVLVRETTSRDAILRFMNVVRGWRRVGDDFRGQLSQIGKCKKPHRPGALDSLRTACDKNSQLFSLLEILTSVQLVRNLDRHISTFTPKSIDELLEIRGLDKNNTTTRKSVKNDLAGYQKWDRLCGEMPQYTYEGILCFVPPVFKDSQKVTRTQIQRLRRDDIALFRSKLHEVECIQILCEVGRAFQSGIFGGPEFPERPFEAQSEESLSTLTLVDLLDLL